MNAKTKTFLNAVRHGDEETVRHCLEQGVDPSKVLSEGMNITPLMLAAQHGQQGVAALLIEGGALLEQADFIGYTPLSYAVKASQPDMVEFLLARGANVQAQGGSADKAPVIIQAILAIDPKYGGETISREQKIRNLQERILPALVGAGADVNAVSVTGDTPLHYAGYESAGEVSQWLLGHGADPQKRNHDGRLPEIPPVGRHTTSAANRRSHEGKQERS